MAEPPTRLGQLPPPARTLLMHLASFGRDGTGGLTRVSVEDLPERTDLTSIELRRAFDQLKESGLVGNSSPIRARGVFPFEHVFLTIVGEALASGHDVLTPEAAITIAINVHAPINASPINIGGNQTVHFNAPTRGAIVLREAPTAWYSLDHVGLYVFARVENRGGTNTWINSPTVVLCGRELPTPAPPILGWEPLAVPGYTFGGAGPRDLGPGTMEQFYWSVPVNNLGHRALLAAARNERTHVGIRVRFERGEGDLLTFDIETD